MLDYWIFQSIRMGLSAMYDTHNELFRNRTAGMNFFEYQPRKKRGRLFPSSKLDGFQPEIL
jgi:hypothetical protein